MNTLPSRLLAAVASLSLTACSLGSRFEAQLGEVERLPQVEVPPQVQLDRPGVVGDQVWRPQAPLGHYLSQSAVWDPVGKRLLRFGAGGTFALASDRWVPIATVGGPSRHWAPAVVFDTARNHVVLFDGADGSTWEFDGRHWANMDLAGPAPRDAPRLAYDDGRGVTVLMGGYRWVLEPEGYVFEDLRDVWEYDGFSWVQKADCPDHIESNPAYDPRQGGLVVTTRDNLGQRLSRYDGVSWSGTPMPDPAASLIGELASLVFDPSTNDLLAVTYLNDTDGPVMAAYRLQGTSWALDSARAPNEWAPTAVWDPVASRLVVVSQNSRTVQVREGGAWRTLRLGPPQASEIAFDATRQGLIAVGVSRDSREVETWEFSAGVWSLASETGLPADAQLDTLNHDTVRKVTLLTLGRGRTTELWAWNGAVWTQLPSPPVSLVGQMSAFDGRRGVLVLYGGQPRTGLSYEEASGLLQEWDGVSWRQVTPDAGPTIRVNAAMAWDGTAQRVRMFGGMGDPKVSLGLSSRDDWVWDGQAWSESPAPYGPTARWGAAYTWDPVGGRMLMAGGATRYAGDLQDTWSYDGRVWTAERIFTPKGRLVSDGSRLYVFSEGVLLRLERAQ